MKSSLEGIMSTQREAERVFRELASRAGAGWMPSTSGEGKAEKKAETPGEADALRSEVLTLREKLRTLEDRLEKKREK
jgi:hypothetical protein